MYILAILLFALSSNIDNFTVGISYGIKKINISLINNILIATISSLGTFISMSIGLVISKFISPAIANTIGCIILILLGSWFTIDFLIKDKHLKKSCNSKQNITCNCANILDNPEEADMDNSGHIDSKECVILAFALTINNFGLGVGASIVGLNIFMSTIFTFIFSILSLSFGAFVGKHCLSKCCGKFAPLISALIIIILGVYELFV